MRTSALALLVLLGACGSVTQYQTADPVGAKRWQGMAALGIGSFKDEPQQSQIPTANVELGARYGITDEIDVGLKIFTLGIEASVRARVIEGGVGAWSVALLGAVNDEGNNKPSPGNDAAILAQLRLGVVATKHRSARWGWNLGAATTGSLFVPAGGGHATGVLLGVYAGFAWRFGAKWSLVPELSIHHSIAGDVPVDGSVVQLGTAIARDF